MKENKEEKTNPLSDKEKFMGKEKPLDKEKLNNLISAYSEGEDPRKLIDELLYGSKVEVSIQFAGSAIRVIPDYKERFFEDMCLRSVQEVMLMPGQIVKIETGIVMTIPVGFTGQMCLHWGNGVTILDSPGRVLSGKEIVVTLINHSRYAHRIKVGEVVAYFAVLKMEGLGFVEIDHLKTKGSK